MIIIYLQIETAARKFLFHFKIYRFSVTVRTSSVNNNNYSP